MSVQIQFKGNVVCQDTVTDSISFSDPVNITSAVGTTFTNTNALTISTTPVAITLPTSPVLFLYIQNTHLTNTVTVTWTPNGGASNPSITLAPGSFIAFSEATATNGITALTVVGSATATTLRYILAG